MSECHKRNHLIQYNNPLIKLISYFFHIFLSCRNNNDNNNDNNDYNDYNENDQAKNSSINQPHPCL